MRLRIQFSKTDAMRYTSHLDLHRTWERTFRRADLPLAYSEGFHPQPRINLASALPLGITSDCELVDIWIEYPIEISAITEKLNYALPPGIKIVSIEEVSNSLPSMQSDLVSMVYQVTIPDEIEHMADRIESLLNSEKLMRVRRGKKYDLRPLIQEINIVRDQAGPGLMLIMRLSARENATGRPDEVLDELSIDPTTVQIHRIRLIFNNPNTSPPVIQHQKDS